MQVTVSLKLGSSESCIFQCCILQYAFPYFAVTVRKLSCLPLISFFLYVSKSERAFSSWIHMITPLSHLAHLLMDSILCSCRSSMASVKMPWQCILLFCLKERSKPSDFMNFPLWASQILLTGDPDTCDVMTVPVLLRQKPVGLGKGICNQIISE